MIQRFVLRFYYIRLEEYNRRMSKEICVLYLFDRNLSNETIGVINFKNDSYAIKLTLELCMVYRQLCNNTFYSYIKYWNIWEKFTDVDMHH